MKKYVFAVLLVGAAVASFAFTRPAKHKLDMKQWEFIGQDNTEAVNADNYRELGLTPTFECDAVEETICTISAPVDPASNPADPRPLFDASTNPVSHPTEYEATFRSEQ